MARLVALSVASEIYPLIKTGGLADVTGALPAALAAEDIDMHTLVPGYPAIMRGLEQSEEVWSDAAFFGGPARLLRASASGLRLFVLDAPHLFDRPGNPYSAPGGQDWPDNPQRFAALAYAGALLGRNAISSFAPHIVHAHDWQAGLCPAYLALAHGKRPATIMTIHNLAFQGQVPASLLDTLRLPHSAYTPDGVEYYQSIGMLKAGLRYADRLTTVSPSYAAEICTAEGGMGMDGLLRARADRLTGILNGIDTQVWNPEADALIPAKFSAADPAARARCKTGLQQQFGLAESEGALLFGVVSRLSHQKGLDVLLEGLAALDAAGAQLVMLGAGDATLEDAFTRAAQARQGRMAVKLGYDEGAAHMIQAGSDAILVPSRFEPCGLTQLCALRYGALPVVSRVGGLADTVIDANAAARSAGVATGFQFAPVTAGAFSATIARVARAWRDRPGWRAMQRNAMRSDVGWVAPARAYAALYRDAIAARG